MYSRVVRENNVEVKIEEVKIHYRVVQWNERKFRRSRCVVAQYSRYNFDAFRAVMQVVCSARSWEIDWPGMEEEKERG